MTKKTQAQDQAVEAAIASLAADLDSPAITDHSALDNVNPVALQFSAPEFRLPTSRQRPFIAEDGSASIKLATVYLTMLPSQLRITCSIKRRDLVELKGNQKYAVSEFYLSTPTATRGTIHVQVFSTDSAAVQANYDAWRESVVRAYQAWLAGSDMTGAKPVNLHENRGRVVERTAIAE